MLYSSTLTVVEHVRFLNNRGYQGGALMLVGTIMQTFRESETKRNTELDLEDVHILEEHHTDNDYVSYRDS